MASEKIIVSATDSGGNSVQRTFDNVNPEATNAQLAAFGSKIAALSENTYAKTDRISRVNCDSEASTLDTRPTPTLTVSNANFSCALNSIANTSLSYSGDGTIIFYDFVRVNVSNASAACMVGHTPLSNGDPQVYVMPDKGFGSTSGDSYSFKIGATETDNYKAPTPISCTFTIS